MPSGFSEDDDAGRHSPRHAHLRDMMPVTAEQLRWCLQRQEGWKGMQTPLVHPGSRTLPLPRSLTGLEVCQR